ncbi:hypothetical protein, partial [Sulfitobacter sp. HI0054]
EDKDFDPLIGEVQNTFNALPWVRESRLRLREEGRFLTGTIYVVAHENGATPERVEAAEAELLDLHWRIHDISIMPRTKIAGSVTIEGADDGTLPLRSGARRRPVG